MGTVTVIGEHALAQGYALVGANVLVAETAEDARAQWERLPPDVPVVILTPTAAAALGASRTSPTGPMTVVMPA